MSACRPSKTSLTWRGFRPVPVAICRTTSPRERRLDAGVALNGFFAAVFADVGFLSSPVSEMSVDRHRAGRGFLRRLV